MLDGEVSRLGLSQEQNTKDTHAVNWLDVSINVNCIYNMYKTLKQNYSNT